MYLFPNSSRNEILFYDMAKIPASLHIYIYTPTLNLTLILLVRSSFLPRPTASVWKILRSAPSFSHCLAAANFSCVPFYSQHRLSQRTQKSHGMYMS